MAVNHGHGKVETDGLVFSYDTSDRQNSFKGRPTTNLWDTILNTQSLRAHTKHYWDGRRWIVNGTYSHPGAPGPKGVHLGIVFKHKSGALNSSWSGNSYGYMLRDIACTNGATVTQSCWVYASRDCDLTAIPSVIEQEAGGETSVPGYPTQYDMSKKANWQVIAKKATSDGQVRFIPTYARKNGVTDGSFKGFYMWALPQVTETNHVVKPILPGASRSHTNSLRDLTGRAIANLSTVSFDTTDDIVFDGTDDYIDLDTDVLSTNGHYTLEAWLKPNGSSWGNNAVPLYNTYKNSSAYGIWHHFGHDNVLRWRHAGTNYTTGDLSGIGLVANTWQLTTVTWDGTTLRLYKNGVQTNSTTAPKGFTRSTGSPRIGRLATRTSGALYAWNGEIAKQNVYNKALTLTEVKKNFNIHKGRFGL